jgi:opacity protein-like surface antigen
VIPDTTEDLVSDSKTVVFSPLASWQASWIKGISTTLEANYSETNSNEYVGSTPIPSKMVTRGGSASFAYTFSAPGGINLPLLKSLKFTSNLSLNVLFNYNRTTNYYTDLTIPATNTSTIGSSLGLSYNFSSSITGGANFDYTQNNDKNTDQDTKRVGLNTWVNINF